ncbi:MAG: gliding motility lipoprotein GldD [Bacteroidia bacterium]|nr:gliding motility lipoprotein GldD [Bacteroidia bacterium]
MIVKNNYLFILVILISLSISSCSNDNETFAPKPKGYFRINLPKQEYIKTSLNCPFNFLVSNQTTFVKHHSNNACWYNIVYPKLNAAIYISYFDLHNNLKELTEDSRDLAYKHTSKAQYINEKQIYIPQKKISGILYEIGGNAASNCQFFITDSTHHFVRGALYFNNVPNADSIAPVLNYIQKDIFQLMESIEWK